jgi:LuxR family maltose regulon positive regulatory protein
MTVLLDLINELSRRNEEMILILDDYHLITEQSIHVSLRFLLEHLPSNLHLVLSTRTDPVLPLPQLRVHGQLVEIRDLDLRFRLEETNSFLTQMVENPLTEEEVNLLEARTEGWVAGLQLAALALRKREDRAAFLQAYTGSYRHLLDYIQYEILQHQPELMQRFLLQIAVLPHMNAVLCQAVTRDYGTQTCQLLLEELQRNNLFIIPLDEQRQWYRFHDLFREALLACLQARQPELLPILQIRAACWYEQQGLFPEAIEAALQARDFPRAAGFIERVLAPHSFRNAYPLLRRWLECMPQETLTASPILSFAYAEALVFTSDRRSPTTRARAAQPLESAERGFRAQKDNQKLAQVLSLRATLAFFQNDLPTAFTLAHQMLLLQPAGEHHWRGSSLLMLGVEALLAGEMERARERILEARLAYQADHSLPGLLITPLLLGEIALGQGEMRQASQFYRQVQAEEENAAEELFQHQLTSETGTKEMFFTRLALEGLAQLAYERNELDTADQLLSQARELGGFQTEELHFLTSGSLLRARILHACGKSAQAQEWLSQLMVQACSPQFLCEIRTCMARIALATGDVTKTEDWSQTAEYSDVALWRVRQEEKALLLARLRIAQAESEQARRILAPWKVEAKAQNRLRSVLEIHILEALASFTEKQLPEARQLMLPVLKRAQGEGYQRLFLDEGLAMQALLKSTLPYIQEKPLATFVRSLLHAFGQEQTIQRTPGQEKFSELLSSQEQRVLHLLVEGHSNQEIAATLIVSVNTVKAHVKNLYRKLNVANRVQAAEVARSQHLL